MHQDNCHIYKLIHGCDGRLLVLQKSHFKVFDHLASLLCFSDNDIGISAADCEVIECICWQGGARRMLKQLKGKSSDETLDDIDADDEFSDLGVLDDSNSMYMVGNVSLQVIAASSYLPARTATFSLREQPLCTSLKRGWGTFKICL